MKKETYEIYLRDECPRDFAPLGPVEIHKFIEGKKHLCNNKECRTKFKNNVFENSTIEWGWRDYVYFPMNFIENHCPKCGQKGEEKQGLEYMIRERFSLSREELRQCVEVAIKYGAETNEVKKFLETEDIIIRRVSDVNEFKEIEKWLKTTEKKESKPAKPPKSVKKMNHDELKAVCRKSSIDSTGTKKVLLTRLENQKILTG